MPPAAMPALWRRLKEHLDLRRAGRGETLGDGRRALAAPTWTTR